MPDGWETISKSQDGNIWEMSQREEDILMQEFERRIAYSKFQVLLKRKILQCYLSDPNMKHYIVSGYHEIYYLVFHAPLSFITL